METLLDRAHLDRQTFGDADLAREVLGLFSEQCARLTPGLADPGLRPSVTAPPRAPDTLLRPPISA